MPLAGDRQLVQKAIWLRTFFLAFSTSSSLRPSAMNGAPTRSKFAIARPFFASPSAMAGMITSRV